MADHDRKLSDRYRIARPGEPGSVDAQRVVDLWIREGAMPPAEARRRAEEILFVAIDSDDGAVGAGTAYLAWNEQLRLDLWHYRTYIGGNHRESDLAWLLLFASIEHLRSRHIAREDTRAAGMFMAVQNKGLKATRDEAIWSASRFAFVGQSPKGAHHRVLYFPGTSIAGTGASDG
jgi:hypothetical protein